LGRQQHTYIYLYVPYSSAISNTLQILSELIENLGIELRITEEYIREQIDKDRVALGLQPLPPHADKPDPWDFLKKHQPDSVEEVFHVIVTAKSRLTICRVKITRATFPQDGRKRNSRRTLMKRPWDYPTM
jgi:hypothetical protein